MLFRGSFIKLFVFFIAYLFFSYFSWSSSRSLLLDITHPDLLNFVHHLITVLICSPFIFKQFSFPRFLQTLPSTSHTFSILILHYVSSRILTVLQHNAALSFISSVSAISVLNVALLSKVLYKTRVSTSEGTYAVIYLTGLVFMILNEVTYSPIILFLILVFAILSSSRDFLIWSSCVTSQESFFGFSRNGVHLVFLSALFSLILDSFNLISTLVSNEVLALTSVFNRLLVMGVSYTISSLLLYSMFSQLMSPLFAQIIVICGYVNVIPWFCVWYRHAVNRYTVLGMSICLLASLITVRLTFVDPSRIQSKNDLKAEDSV
ncbi:hypothetical protein RCL1_007601 [Eukaryota sp. TZLM3-RCL]